MNNPLTTNNFSSALEKAKAIAAKLQEKKSQGKREAEDELEGDGQLVKKEKLAVTTYKPKMTTQVMKIPTHLAALVLGRSGENLRNLETCCNVRIVVDDQITDDKRSLTIEGEELSVGEAKSRIDDIVFGTGAISLLTGTNQTGHQTIYITVPTTRVGLVIGKGGETIRNLQDRTGAKINVCKDGEIDTPPNMKTVVVNGPPHCIQQAQMLIDEIVSGHSYAGTFGLTGHAETIFVPKEKVGLVIGKGGETLKQIQLSCDVKLNIDANSDKKQERPVTISGTKEAIQKAKEQVYERVYGNKYGIPGEGASMGAIYDPEYAKSDPAYEAAYGVGIPLAYQHKVDQAALYGYDRATYQAYVEYYAQYYASLGYPYEDEQDN